MDGLRNLKVKLAQRFTPQSWGPQRAPSSSNPIFSSNTSPTTQAGTINVVLFGETRIGKRSIISLIAGEEVVPTSSDPGSSGMQCGQYDIQFDGLNAAIFDTVSLEEARSKENSNLNAIEKGYELITRLSTTGGIHLLLFCLHEGHVTATAQRNYRLFYECLCDTKVPVALVVTGLEREEDMENWWRRYNGDIEQYGIKCDGHACIAVVEDKTHEGDPELLASRRKVCELLKDYATKNNPYVMETHSWFARLGKVAKSFIAKRRNPKKWNAMEVLTKRCKLDHDTAKRVAVMMKDDVLEYVWDGIAQGEDEDKKQPERVMLPHWYASVQDDAASTTQPYPINVVLFGQTGVGKSSIINLIAGKEVAQVSPDAEGCTAQCARHDVQFDGSSFAIFDTIGLEEPRIGTSDYLRTIQKAYELIVELSATGGVHLLLFCMTKGRITATVQRNYRLFCECLCRTDVPIALVVTGLEGEEDMEDWWRRCKGDLDRFDIKCNDHACITAVMGDTPEEDLKFTESQEKVRKILKDCAIKNYMGTNFITKPKRRDVIKVLTQRCKFDRNTARDIANMMDRVQDGKNGDTTRTVIRLQPQISSATSKSEDPNKAVTLNDSIPTNADTHAETEPHGLDATRAALSRRWGSHRRLSMKMSSWVQGCARAH